MIVVWTYEYRKLTIVLLLVPLYENDEQFVDVVVADDVIWRF